MPIIDKARQLAKAVITRRLSIYSLLCGLFFTVFIASFLIYAEYDQAVHSTRKTLEYIKLGYLQPVSSSLYKMDQYQLESELQGILRLHPIVRVEVTEERAHGLTVSLGTADGRFTTEERFPLTYEVGGKMVRIGTLSVTYSMGFLYGGLVRQTIWILFVAIVLGSAILVAFLYFFNRIVVSPLLTITDFALTQDLSTIGSELNLDRPPHKADELDILVRSFNEMLSRIRNDIDTIRQAEKAVRESEEKYKLIFDGANDAIFIHNFEGRIMSANSLAIERLGYPREVLLSMSVQDVDAPEEGDEPEKRIAIVMERDHLTFETVHKCSDGTRVPVEVSARKIMWDGGPAIMSICRDTTFRKVVEKALQESEKKYHSIFDNAAEGIFQTSPDGHFLSANPALAAMFGYESPEELISSITDLSTQGYVNPVDRERYKELLEKNDIIRGFEVQHYKKDGSLLWIRISARTVRDESGTLLYYEGTVEDVTDRKRAEEELRVAHERLFDIIEFLPDATFVIDRARRVVAWNKACVKMTGIGPEDMIGKGDYAYAVPFYGERRPILIDLVTMDSDFIGQHYKSVAQAGNTLYGEVFVPNVYDGKGAFLAGHASTLLDREGNIVGAIESVRDITELRHLEAQLHQSQKMEAIGTLAGGIAHDFNNLLTTIIGYSSLLQKDMENTDPRKQYLNQILQSSQKAASLTQSLLAFSRKQVIELKPQSVNSLLKNIEKILKRLLTEDIEFRVILAKPDVAIMGDVTQIDQILMNFATNARDAMPRGGSLVISVDQVILNSESVKAHGYLEPGAYAVISVNDTGCGMDEPTKEKIFEPFFTTKEVGRGTGLGLSIVYGIVKQHDGHINVYSEPGKGSVFKIYIPAIKACVEAEEEGEAHDTPGGSETLLVAEDNDALRGLTRELLTRKGYSVVEATDGDDAVSKFTEHKDSIDLLLLDVVMPKKNGKEAYEAIRKIRPDIKTVFMSGYTGDVVRTKEIQDETVDFISKPMLPGDLLMKIREVLDR